MITQPLDMYAVQESRYSQLDKARGDNKNLKKVCDDFESYFVQQLLDISLKSSKIGGEGAGSDIIKGLYTEGISRSTNGTFGISDMLFKHLSEKES